MHGFQLVIKMPDYSYRLVSYGSQPKIHPAKILATWLKNTGYESLTMKNVGMFLRYAEFNGYKEIQTIVIEVKE